MSILDFPFIWFLSWFPWKRDAANKQTTETRVSCGFVEVITVSMSQITTYMFRMSFRSTYIRPLISVLWCPLRFPRKIDVPFGSFFIYFIYIYYRIPVSNTISCGAGSANLSGAPLFLCGVHVDWSLVFCIMFYGSLFVLLWFFLLP